MNKAKNIWRRNNGPIPLRISRRFQSRTDHQQMKPFLFRDVLQLDRQHRYLRYIVCKSLFTGWEYQIKLPDFLRYVFARGIGSDGCMDCTWAIQCSGGSLYHVVPLLENDLEKPKYAKLAGNIRNAYYEEVAK